MVVDQVPGSPISASTVPVAVQHDEPQRKAVRYNVGVQDSTGCPDHVDLPHPWSSPEHLMSIVHTLIANHDKIPPESVSGSVDWFPYFWSASFTAAQGFNRSYGWGWTGIPR